jgi:hypothetical protein
MESSAAVCDRGHSIPANENQGEGKCPNCGRPFADTNQGTAHPKHLTDTMIEATCEIMAEEGAIWSGAR